MAETNPPGPPPITAQSKSKAFCTSKPKPKRQSFHETFGCHPAPKAQGATLNKGAFLRFLLRFGQVFILALTLVGYIYEYRASLKGHPISGWLSSFHGSYLDKKFEWRFPRKPEA